MYQASCSETSKKSLWDVSLKSSASMATAQTCLFASQDLRAFPFRCCFIPSHRAGHCSLPLSRAFPSSNEWIFLGDLPFVWSGRDGWVLISEYLKFNKLCPCHLKGNDTSLPLLQQYMEDKLEGSTLNRCQ